MSGFTSEILEKKLIELNNSQQSIQTLSLWLIHHRKHNKLIVQTWHKELKKVKPSRRLTFMYLANDVIQNSRKKGPEFTKEFISALKHGFEFVAKEADDKTVQSLERIINIWNERNIYDKNLLKEFKKSLKNVSGDSLSIQSSNKELIENLKKRKEHAKEESSPSKKVKPTLLSQSDAELPFKGEDVDSKELINCLKSLENTASSDVVVRERIAKLPPEVSDISSIDKLRDKNEAEKLSKQVDEACVILNDYNARLAKELEDRKKISYKLAAYCRYQRDIQKEAQKTLVESIERLNKIKQVKSELKMHLKNLPDLTKLPSLKEAPLPKPENLFVSAKKEDEKSNCLADKDQKSNELDSKEEKKNDNYKKDFEIETKNCVSAV